MPGGRCQRKNKDEEEDEEEEFEGTIAVNSINDVITNIHHSFPPPAPNNP